jgi:ClpX C4-type zinc finger
MAASCDGCLEHLRTVLAVTRRSASTPIATIQQVGGKNGDTRCSFCGKRRQQVKAIVSAGAARICSECLDLGSEIVRGNSG